MAALPLENLPQRYFIGPPRLARLLIRAQRRFLPPAGVMNAGDVDRHFLIHQVDRAPLATPAGMARHAAGDAARPTP